MVTSLKKFTRKHLASAKFFAKITRKTSPKTLILYIGVVSLLLILIGFALVYFVYLHTLPDIKDIEKDVLPESTVIYDRKGNEIYNLYSKEKRTYVSFDQISSHMRDAIVATEDKTFFENQGVDFRGLVRSGVNYIIGKTDKVEGTSTISQQLIRNTLLSNERSIERKWKEMYLSYRLNSEYSKEKILELYLNKISFGNNAYGIEEAAKTYFGKSAKDLWVLGSTILASIPKWPTYYSPYSHRDRLMGYLFAYSKTDTENKIFLDSPDKMKEYRSAVDAFKKTVSDMKMEPTGDELSICNLSKETFKKDPGIDSKGCVTIGYKDLLDFLNSLRIDSETLPSVAPSPKTAVAPTPAKTATGSTKTSSGAVSPKTASGSTEKTSSGKLVDLTSSSPFFLEYNTGRKDFVAERMFEDGKISVDDYKSTIINGLEFQFKKYSEDIKYPYFVFYVRDYLENKYGKDFESRGGLRIYTTIDPDLQNKAEDLVKKQVAINISKYGASSAALVSMDNKTGEILSMVGGPNYFDEDHGGNVNMITARRQPGSSFKPIVYALAMSKEAISPDTPIYDVDTNFGKWNPNNYDQKFLGKMKVRTALDYSRNIPAIKMFYVAGGEESVVKFARSIGLLSLNEEGAYGAPLAIGTGEVKPIEMLSAYSVFANGGWKREMTPILRIEDKKGNLIEKSMPDNGKLVFSEAASYLLSTIISDARSRPGDFWNNVLTLKDRVVAAKTGTSNKDVSTATQKKILPRDLWTAGYTPQITTVVWAGNVDGTETKGNCDGLNCAAPIWHDYMEYAHRNLPKETFKRPDSVYTATISGISGKLASANTPAELQVTSIFAVKPTAYENSMKQIEVDSLCNGKVTDATPPDAIKKGYLVDVSPIIDGYDKAWLTAIRGWVSSEAGAAYFSNGASIITNYKDVICERPDAANSRVEVNMNLQNGDRRRLGNNTFNITYSGTNPIVKIRLLRDDELFKEVAIDGSKTSWEITIASNLEVAFAWEHTISAVAIDSYGYSGKISAIASFERSDYTPSISFTSPAEGTSPRIYQNQYFNIRFNVQSTIEVVAVNVLVDNKLEKILGAGEAFVASINEKNNLAPGKHTATIEIIDAQRGRSSKSLEFEIIE